jgi:phosphoserine phosphatase
MRLALFDLDHTLLPIDSDHACWQFIAFYKLTGVAT